MNHLYKIGQKVMFGGEVFFINGIGTNVNMFSGEGYTFLYINPLPNTATKSKQTLKVNPSQIEVVK